MNLAPVMLVTGFVPKAEVRALTGLRGLAALNVMIGHYDIHSLPFLHCFDFTDAAVDVFFCLSSFTLCMVYLSDRKRFNSYDFAVARFARIYPLFALVMTVGLLTGYFWGDEAFPHFSDAFILKHTLAQFFLIAALPIKSLYGFWNPAAWSVAIEGVCYLFLFPVLVKYWPQVLRLSPRLLLAGTVCCALICHATYVKLYDPAINLVGFSGPTGYFTYWVALFRGSSMFISGALAYAALHRHRELQQATGLLTDAVTLLIIAIIAGASFGFVNRHAMVVLAPLLIMGMMDHQSLTARVLGSGPLHFLGLISYSIYLWHLPVYEIVLHLRPAFMASEITRILAPLVATLGLSVISYYFFETPLRRHVRWLFRAKRGKAARRNE
ncbi:acyltransferase family protein [Acidisoma sp. 7E03]